MRICGWKSKVNVTPVAEDAAFSVAYNDERESHVYHIATAFFFLQSFSNTCSANEILASVFILLLFFSVLLFNGLFPYKEVQNYFLLFPYMQSNVHMQNC